MVQFGLDEIVKIQTEWVPKDDSIMFTESVPKYAMDLNEIVSRPNFRLVKIVEYFRSGDKKRTGFKLCYGGDKVGPVYRGFYRKQRPEKKYYFKKYSKNANFMIGETADSYVERRFTCQPHFVKLSKPCQDE